MRSVDPGALRRLLPLFSDSRHHAIARAGCLGLAPCDAFADDFDRPTAAVLTLSRFGIAFAAGDSRHAVSLLDALRGLHPWYEVIDPPASWHPALAAWSRESRAVARVGFRCDPTSFDRHALQAMATPPSDCVLCRYDRALVEQALSADWSEDQIGVFLNADAFLRDGFGVALVRDGELLAGCGSFCRHPDGVEVQIDTRPDQRGNGYATCVGAAFVLEALSRDLIPYWDAANHASLRLAQKLGFHMDKAYVAWVLISPATSPESALQKTTGTEGRP